MKNIIEIDGNNFSNINDFYDEIEKKFCKNLGWKFGRNLDAFNDVLRGGYGIYEYQEPVKIIWHNADKSRQDLGYDQTIIYLQEILSTCHPSNVAKLEKQLEKAKNRKGGTYFDIVIKIIKSHKHIILILE